MDKLKSEAMYYNFRVKNLFSYKVVIMIFIWGMAFFALVFSLPLFLFAILIGIVDIFRELLRKHTTTTATAAIYSTKLLPNVDATPNPISDTSP
ncbi:DUF4400 domain-containing protein [Kingella kingae]|uniref:DUF4400 domain-containing protein n=1 Tax=Kingella kingae TaxID=504 RepID=UPI001EE3679E|nr:DUF4400 domain-containing protein [Kingella kingae]